MVLWSACAVASGVMFNVLLGLGESDCEAIGGGDLAQPANAISSLVFSVVGIAIWLWASRATGWERRFRIVFGGALVLTGIGSYLFHGPQSAGSQFAHDITFLAALVILGVTNIARVLGWPERTSWGLISIVILSFAGVLWIWPSATNALMVLSVLTIVVGEILIRRRGSGSGQWYAVTVIALVVAAASFLVGRTGSPLCDPESILQGHALWHLASAAAVGAYAVATSPARTEALE